VRFGLFFLGKGHPTVVLECGVVSFIVHDFLRVGFSARADLELHLIPFVGAAFDHFGNRTAGLLAGPNILTLHRLGMDADLFSLA